MDLRMNLINESLWECLWKVLVAFMPTIFIFWYEFTLGFTLIWEKYWIFCFHFYFLMHCHFHFLLNYHFRLLMHFHFYSYSFTFSLSWLPDFGTKRKFSTFTFSYISTLSLFILYIHFFTFAFDNYDSRSEGGSGWLVLKQRGNCPLSRPDARIVARCNMAFRFFWLVHFF